MNWSRKYHEPFVYAALGIALSAGFGYGATLLLARAFELPLGAWYGALTQAHGHAQLFGWVGLFVMGVGMFFLPRLRGMTLQGVSRAPFAWGLLVCGIALRSIVQPYAAFAGMNGFLRALFLLSAILEMAGMLVVVSMLAQTLRARKELPRDAPAYAIQGLAQLAFTSLTLAFLFNLLGAWNLAAEGKTILAPRYEQMLITLILYGVALPMIFVFSLRTLPLFLRLPFPPLHIWRTFTLIYFLALALRVLPYLLAIVDDALIFTERVLRANFINLLVFDALAVVGTLTLNVCILFFVARLNFFAKRPPMAPAHNARANYPDHGEYGRFELLMYSAFVWLVVASVMDLLRALPVLNEKIFIPQDAARHALMLGCITLLIFGMAVRMLPGFSGKRALAYPRLVVWLAVLGNLAACLRVVPLFFSSAGWSAALLGLSGIVGWCAVLLLAVVLWKTFRT